MVSMLSLVERYTRNVQLPLAAPFVALVARWFRRVVLPPAGITVGPAFTSRGCEVEGRAAPVGGDEGVVVVLDPALELPLVRRGRGPVGGRGDPVDVAGVPVDDVGAAAAHAAPDRAQAPGHGDETQPAIRAGVESPEPVVHVPAGVEPAPAALRRVRRAVDGGRGPVGAGVAPGPAEPPGESAHRAVQGDDADVVGDVAVHRPSRPRAEDRAVGPTVGVGDRRGRHDRVRRRPTRGRPRSRPPSCPRRRPRGRSGPR